MVPSRELKQPERTDRTEPTKHQPDAAFNTTSPAQHDQPERDGRAVIAKRPSIRRAPGRRAHGRARPSATKTVFRLVSLPKSTLQPAIAVTARLPWDPLGPLGPPLGPLGPPLAPPRATSGSSWAPSGPPLGPRWAPSGPPLGPLWVITGPLWAPSGPPLGHRLPPLAPRWPPSGPPLGPRWAPLGP